MKKIEWLLSDLIATVKLKERGLRIDDEPTIQQRREKIIQYVEGLENEIAKLRSKI